VEAQGEAIYIRASGFRTRVDDARAPKLRDHVGKEVVFGIRPSDMYDKDLPGAVEASADNTVQVEVEVIEPMGAECVLYVNCGGVDMVVNLDSATAAKEGQPLEVLFDMSKCHVFDKETDITII
jgi:multiple sugar transport system ATP-binding protein